MDPELHARLTARAEIIKAMAHPTRLFIVEQLAKGERCVAELTDMIGADISTVSKHLAVLKTVGILQSEKRGAQVYYTLRVPCVLNFFGCIEAVIKSSAEDKMNLVRATRSRR